VKWAFVFQQAYFTGLLSTFSICFVKLVVFSHKPCWPSPGSPSGYATDGGFPFQMKALSELFDETRVLVPCFPRGNATGEVALEGHNLRVVPLSPRHGSGFFSKLNFLPWLLRNGGTIWRELRRADAVHAPIPGDVGTVGMVGAWFGRKPLFVRYCGNWLTMKSHADRFWHWFMEQFAGGRNVMLATGGTELPPSAKTPDIHWIFSTSLTELELSALAARQVVLERHHFRLIIVGRQKGAKGTEILIQALALIHHAYPEAALDVVGDGSAVPALKRLAAELGIGEKVVFHGKVNHAEVIRLLQRAHVFCFPSKSEGFPKVVLEALACGLPVIATPVSVLPQLLGNGCGVLMEEATPEALARGVESIIADGARYATMSRKAVETAQQYSLEAWRDTIGGYLTAAWGPLKKSEIRK
jgi:glycosyltransferase involved in cell wall biosynthesis